MIEIVSNGSKWFGEEPDTLGVLFGVLKNHPLDRSFEKYGNFIYVPREWAYGEHREIVAAGLIYPENLNMRHIFGNFFALSHVFNIATDELELILKFSLAIEENKRRPDYRSQEDPFSEAAKCSRMKQWQRARR